MHNKKMQPDFTFMGAIQDNQDTVQMKMRYSYTL